MNKREKYFIDLSKLSEEQQKHIFSLLPEHENEEDDELYEITDDHYILTYHYFKDWEWIVGVESFKDGRTELTYPEFIKLFEGGEGETENIYDIDFGGNVMARIKIVDNKIEVTNAMNGYGNGIPLSEIRITNSK